MSTHTQRVAEARELGELAGREYQYVANQTCDPSEWTREKQEEWCKILEYIEENPYNDGEYPHRDATDDQNAHYASEWGKAFKQGRHAEQAEQRRKATIS